MESNGQTIHRYQVKDQAFKSSTEMVQWAIDTQTPLVAWCGDVWLPESIEFLTGEECGECFDLNEMPDGRMNTRM